MGWGMFIFGSVCFRFSAEDGLKPILRFEKWCAAHTLRTGFLLAQE